MKMPPGKVLQPVLKMKVDELFLCWLSESSTQTMLQDCLQRIKTPGRTESGGGDARQPGPPLAASAPAPAPACKPSVFDSLGAPSPAPTSTALPLGAATSPRTGPPVRGSRRSTGTRVVS